MGAQSALHRGRQAAEKLMIDECTIVRVTGSTEGAGGVISETTTAVYSGKCRLMVRTRERLGGSWVDLAEQQVIVSRLELHIPMDAPEALEGDRVVMVSSVLDPQIVGKTLIVRDSMMKSFLTARRITVLEMSS
jgi:hypothetical protein